MATDVGKEIIAATASSSSSALPGTAADRQQVEHGRSREDQYSHDVEAGRGVADHHSITTVSVEEQDDASSISSRWRRSTHDVQDASSPVRRVLTNVSLGPDAPLEHYTSFTEVPDSVYNKFSSRRKLVIVVLLSFCSFLAPVSSTTVLSATPEVAAEFHTTGSIVDLTNALYMLFMGISPIVWGPFSEVWGRKTIIGVSALLFFACSIGTALSPNLAAFFVFRILTAFEGTAFLLVGSACLQDIYRPTERATAMGWFMSGTLIGPAIGPFIGGIIVTYTSWRVIFWVQTGLSGMATLGAFFMLPETIHRKKYDDLQGLSKSRKAAVLWDMVNPWKVLKLLLAYPNLLLAGLASAALVWNMYSLLTPIRYVINPRFNLNTPMQSGLFYLAPGAGYLVGTFMGGRYADHVVKKHIRLSHERVPEDRMRSALPFLGVAIPACMLVYGWAVDRDAGGIPVVVVMLFLQGVAQLFCFPSLNTYCLDVMQGRGSDVIAGNYFVRYLFACLGTAVVLPAIERVGVGWFSTISALFLMVSALGTWATVTWGRGWRERVDEKRRARRGLDGSEKVSSRRKGGSDGGVRRAERDVEDGRGEEACCSGIANHDHEPVRTRSDPEKGVVEVPVRIKPGGNHGGRPDVPWPREDQAKSTRQRI